MSEKYVVGGQSKQPFLKKLLRIIIIIYEVRLYGGQFKKCFAILS